ncbi:hypothetical protein [Arcicella rigui]|uniref:Uncharacterized protein n=1 Tax=Arcicella rigui TaxID=797020 RepID=A0ABU5QG79_9BACT|nr:hypothetical protein [Arcicella rigui]MEA5141758.1 hypothetical protein [Arcicella rigui]
MIETIKEKMFRLISLYHSTYSDLLSQCNYQETSILLDRLDSENSEFPLSPVIKVVWRNNQIKQSFIFRLYDNFICDFEILNEVTHKKVSINDFIKNRKFKDLEMYLMEGNINDKYHTYLIEVLNMIKSTDLLYILKGEKWIDIPFDWQGHK